MFLNVYLLVDASRWPKKLDPDVLYSLLQARLRVAVDLHVQELGPSWESALPHQPAVVFLLLTADPEPGAMDAVQRWVSQEHLLFATYLDGVSMATVRDLAALTSGQPVSRAPYRIAQHSEMGLERAAAWASDIILHLMEIAPAEPPPVRTAPTRWRNLPSNPGDPHAVPDQSAQAMEGAGGYRLIGARHRGKSHAHHGTFCDDAFAFAATPHWNILAVADGAGTAPLARLGSNLAVTKAVEAMRATAPAQPGSEDLGRAVWAGLRAAFTALRDHANGQSIPLTDLNTTLQVLIHWPKPNGCLIAVAQVGDGIIVAETVDGMYYPPLAEPDSDPEDSGRTLFLTSGPLRNWMERTRVYEFDREISILAMMTDGLAGDLESYGDGMHAQLFEMVRSKVLCYPLDHREAALASFLNYDRRGSFDDRTLVVLSRE